MIPTLTVHPHEAVGFGDDRQIHRTAHAFLTEGDDTLEARKVDKALCQSRHGGKVIVLKRLHPLVAVGLDVTGASRFEPFFGNLIAFSWATSMRQKCFASSVNLS